MTTATKPRMFKTHHPLDESIRIRSVELLNKSLAAASDLTSQIKQAHWNVKGKDFYQLHELFDELYTEVSAHVDLIAERITTLGGYANGTVRMAAENSMLPEYPVEAVNGLDHVAALVERYAKFEKHLQDGIHQTDGWDDADTADLYTEVSRNIGMRLWFLEAHLQGQ